MPLFGIAVIALYVMAIHAVITDPYLSELERGLCLAAVLVGSITGVALVGLYLSHVMRKRFKLNTGTAERG
jgi:hypothetical protein